MRGEGDFWLRQRVDCSKVVKAGLLGFARETIKNIISYKRQIFGAKSFYLIDGKEYIAARGPEKAILRGK